MLKSAAWMIVLFALSSGASGCQSKAGVNDGAGFALLTPSAETRSFIIANDRPFAEQVAGHNRTCMALPACTK
ncbi:hypothetical protein [Mesorhizobium sp. CAU 1741]|uniref:hypothetical protein n=1 Tax=Mesorhizobium sp. CAU 1741 TaxID=3140366 RepID=UPI00325AF6B0